MNRPTKPMMLAINASIDGDQKALEQLVRENKLDKKELAERLEMRQGEKYDLTKGTGPRKRRDGAASSSSGDIEEMIDGRTRLSTLIRLESKIQKLLADKDKNEVAKTRDALKNLDKLRKQLEEAEARLA